MVELLNCFFQSLVYLRGFPFNFWSGTFIFKLKVLILSIRRAHARCGGRTTVELRLYSPILGDNISPLLPRPLGLGDEPPVLMYEASDPLISIWLLRFCCFLYTLGWPGLGGNTEAIKPTTTLTGPKRCDKHYFCVTTMIPHRITML